MFPCFSPSFPLTLATYIPRVHWSEQRHQGWSLTITEPQILFGFHHYTLFSDPGSSPGFYIEFRRCISFPLLWSVTASCVSCDFLSVSACQGCRMFSPLLVETGGRLRKILGFFPQKRQYIFMWNFLIFFHLKKSFIEV